MRKNKAKMAKTKYPEVTSYFFGGQKFNNFVTFFRLKSHTSACSTLRIYAQGRYFSGLPCFTGGTVPCKVCAGRVPFFWCCSVFLVLFRFFVPFFKKKTEHPQTRINTGFPAFVPFFVPFFKKKNGTPANPHKHWVFWHFLPICSVCSVFFLKFLLYLPQKIKKMRYW